MTSPTLYTLAPPTTPKHLRDPSSAGFDPATDEEILAQPCVVEALRWAQKKALEEAVIDLRARAERVRQQAGDPEGEWWEDAAEEIDRVATKILLKAWGISFPGEVKP